MFIAILLFLIFIICLHILLNYNKTARALRKIPGNKGKFIIGNAADVLLSPAELFQFGRDCAKTYEAEGISSFYALGIAGINIYTPDFIEKVISSTKHNDKSVVYGFLRPWLREGLLLSKGSKWFHRRKVLTPAFHFNILNNFITPLEDNSERLIKRLETCQDMELNIIPFVNEVTLNSICETAMGTHLDEEGAKGKSYKEAIYAIGNVLVERFSILPYYSDLIFNISSLGKKQKKLLDVVHGFTREVINKKKEKVSREGLKVYENKNDEYFINKKSRFAMLDLLLKAKKDEMIDDEGIQEEVDTFMFEGHDTTTSGLVFCFLSIANDKQIQDKILAEQFEIFGDSPRHATSEDFSKMRYLECCIKESLRLYPPVHFISRTLSETIQLGKHVVPANTICHIHIFDLHRLEHLYENPLKYDPDRFLPENSVGRHPYAYLPFSAGPRNCIGQRFAMLEMKSVISAVVRNYKLHPITKHTDLVFKSDLVLRTVDPVYVLFKKRSKNCI